MKELEENFEELFEKSVKDVKLDKIVTGKIVEITSKGEIFVDLGYKADGIITEREYSDDENADPKKDFKVGDTITAEILKMNDGYGNVSLSYKRAKTAVVKQELEEKYNSKEVVEAKVKKVLEKGLIANYNGVDVFIPLSLSGISKNENKEDYLDKNVKFMIIEFNLRNKRIIGSIKVLLDEDKKEKEEKFWSEIEIGKTYTGKIVNISSYGAFVDLGAVQGLLHISEMTWKRNEKVENIVKVGQEIEVSVKSFDKDNKKVELVSNIKGENPWNKISEVYKVNDIVNVEVVKITNFGAFVKLSDEFEGLVHISQISMDRITDISKVLEVGQKLNAKIIDIDTENKKIELSIKDLIGTEYDDFSKDEEKIEK